MGVLVLCALFFTQSIGCAETISVEGNFINGTIPSVITSLSGLRKYSTLIAALRVHRSMQIRLQTEELSLEDNEFSGRFPTFLGELPFLGEWCMTSFESRSVLTNRVFSAR